MDRIFCLGALLAGCALVWFAQGQSAAPRVDGATAQRLSQNPRGAVAVAADAERPDDRRDWSSRFEPQTIAVATHQNGGSRSRWTAILENYDSLGTADALSSERNRAAVLPRSPQGLMLRIRHASVLSQGTVNDGLSDHRPQDMDAGCVYLRRDGCREIDVAFVPPYRTDRGPEPALLLVAMLHQRRIVLAEYCLPELGRDTVPRTDLAVADLVRRPAADWPAPWKPRAVHLLRVDGDVQPSSLTGYWGVSGLEIVFKTNGSRSFGRDLPPLRFFRRSGGTLEPADPETRALLETSPRPEDPDWLLDERCLTQEETSD